jgi:C1A family cysteine protease
MQKYNYGLKKKTFDARDDEYHFNKHFKMVEKFPDVMDLEQWMPPVLDQGQLGSCSANGTVEAMEFYQIYSSSPVPPVPPTPPTPPDPNSCMTAFINALPALQKTTKTLAKFVNAQPALWQSIVAGKKTLEASTNYTALSRLFEYYQSRALEGTINEDSGCEIRDALKAAQSGICSEVLWPYQISKFTVKPSAQCYANATWKIASYHTLSDPNNNTANNLNNIYQALANNMPVIIGFTVYGSFENSDIATTGIMPMPKSNESILGGHCCVIIGKKPGYLKVRNSWGESWGKPAGDFWMPEAFVSHKDYDGILSLSDLWTITI